MRHEFELNLDFEKDSWTTEFKGKKLSGKSIEELEKRLEECLKELGMKGEVVVRVKYDWKKLPQWLWQFQSYYFERTWFFRL